MLGDAPRPRAADPGVTLSSTHLEITEGEDATYTVALDVRPEGEVELSIEADSPEAGLSAGGGTPASAIMLTFTESEWMPRTITVHVPEDTDPDDETLAITHQIGGAQYDGVEIPDVTVAITDLMTVSRARATHDWLARFGRSVASTVTDAISQRVTDTPEVDQDSITLAGTRLKLDTPPPAPDRTAVVLPSGQNHRAPTPEELIASSAFAISRLASAGGDAHSGAGSWGFWGAGAIDRFATRPQDGYSVSGDMYSALVGVDHAVDSNLTGVAFSFAVGNGNYEGVDKGVGAGRHTS